MLLVQCGKVPTHYGFLQLERSESVLRCCWVERWKIQRESDRLGCSEGVLMARQRRSQGKEMLRRRLQSRGCLPKRLD
jgi:hypothetical protein